MNVYRVRQADRDLLLAGADLEAVLADRERERLERDERAQARPSVPTVAHLGHDAPRPGENRHAPSSPAGA
ncbi:MAG: hypothetical protein PVJ55_05255 [Anaerolineae bacterium]